MRRLTAIASLSLAWPIALAAQASRPVPVRCGIDVLVAGDFAALAGRKIGLISNHTARSADGTPTRDLLLAAPGLKLVCLFAPEHGASGTQHEGAVRDATHAPSGLPIYSLHGIYKQPTKAMLRGIDTLLFDIQDIGCRFYTYTATMGLAMAAAAEHGKRFVVLDRPNPLGGRVAGTLPDATALAGTQDLVCYHNVPIRHGLTPAELAQLFRRERPELSRLDLHVVPMQNWHRTMSLDATGLTWIDPSPNMRSLRQALLYPGIGLLEFTNLSVGRGTDTPFERIGAPWLEHQRLALALRRHALAGVVFLPVEFTPTTSVFAAMKCRGLEFVVTDRERFDPVRLGIALALELRRLHQAQWPQPGGQDTGGLDRLLRCHDLTRAILAADPAVIATYDRLASQHRARFQRRTAPCLLYPQ